LCSLVLVGLPALGERLAPRRNRSLYSRIHHRLEVAAHTPEDTEYLRMRLARAGVKREISPPTRWCSCTTPRPARCATSAACAARRLREASPKKGQLVE
jgi:general secretion pathway protein A